MPDGSFSQLERLSSVISTDDLIEQRFENDANGNPIYIGYCSTPNAATFLPIWYIVKIEYEGNLITRKRLPILGLGFYYVWDLRASFFP